MKIGSTRLEAPQEFRVFYGFMNILQRTLPFRPSLHSDSPEHFLNGLDYARLEGRFVNPIQRLNQASWRGGRLRHRSMTGLVSCDQSQPKRTFLRQLNFECD